MVEVRQTSRRRRRWPRRLAGVFALLLLLAGGIPLGLVYWYTRPAQVIPVVEDTLEELTGCDVTVGHATVSRDGQVHLEDVTFRVPYETGEFAKLAHVDTVDLFGDPAGLLDGSYHPNRVEVDGLLLFLNEDAEAHTFNFELLTLPDGDDPETATDDVMAIPEITLRRSAIRFGRRTGETVQPQGDLSIEGELLAEEGPDRLYTVALRETDLATGEPDPLGAELTGRFSIEDPLVDLTLDRFSFADEQRYFVPSEFRDLWSRLAPGGDVPRLVLSLRPDERNRFSAEHTTLEMDFENIGLNLDILGAEDPDMQSAALLLTTVESRLTDLRGKLVIEGGRWHFEDAAGRVRQSGLGLSPVTYTIEASGGLSLDDPYDIRVATNRFTLKDRYEFLLALSPLTGEGYRRFRPSGAFSVSARFASEGGGGPPDWLIRLNLIDAKMTHAMFPLPIEQLRGTVDIAADQVVIDGLTGRTPSGGAVSLRGTATPASDIAEVDLTIQIDGLPVDEHLLAALKPGERDNLARFLNQDAYDSLVDRGLISPAGGDAPPFTLGGTVDVTVPVYRPYGEEGDYSIVPELHLAGLSALMADFPYPVTVTDGVVHIGPDFVVVDGLTLTGLTGGALTVDGRADKDPQTGEYLPELMLTNAVLPADALLFAAIGGEAEELLTDLRVGGMLDLAGPLYQRPGDEDVGMELAITLTQGRANPFGGAVVLEDVTGSLTLHGKQITDLALAGAWRDGATLDVAGGVTWDSTDPATGGPLTEADLTFTAHDFFFDRDLLGLLPEDSATHAELAELFDLYDPAGAFDATLRWKPRSDDAPDDYAVTVTPHDLALNLLGGRLALVDLAGTAHVTPETLELRAMRGVFLDPDGVDGTLEADGTIFIKDDPDIALTLSGTTSGLGQTARLLLPDKSVGVLETIQWEGAFAMRDATLEMTAVGSDEQATSFAGTAAFDSAAFVVGGLAVTEAHATLGVRVDDTPTRETPRMSFELDCPSLLAMDRRVTRLRGRADNSADPGVLRTDRVTGSLYGGTVLFEAAMGLGADSETLFRASIHDVQLDVFMQPQEHPDDPGADAPLARDRELGLISGELSMQTGYGEDAPRQGRGTIRVENASLYGDNPLGLGVVEMINLNLPTGRGFEAAAIDFTLVDDTVLFNRLVMETPANPISKQVLQLTGEGTMTFPGLAMDLRLRTTSGGSALRVPFADVIDSLRNELVGIQVTGTLTEPVVGYTFLQNTRNTLNELLSGRPRGAEE